ncbi:MAG: hypothetical protein HYV09_35895 [Deltaproteobacteria bacterium]|nr:hypothetical protein [Deltaproteobacteria bacterium]
MIALLPTALLATACAFRPWTPSVSVAYWSEDVPQKRVLLLPSFAALASRWQLPPQSPWARYGKLTLLASINGASGTRELPDVDALEVVGAAERAATRLAAVGAPPDTMWIVDLRGAASVAFGAALSARAQVPVAPVLTFNNWPAPNELVPAEETLAALITRAPKLPAPNEPSARPVFLLDAWRLAYRFDRPDDGVVDNRYALVPTDFPAPDALATQGVRRVVYVVEDLDETDQEEEDLHHVLRAYWDAGIAVHLVDLAWLEALAAPIDWPARLGAHVLKVPPRRTLLDDPSFYARARGGFGGTHAGPSPFKAGSIIHGGSGYGGGFGG